MRATQSILLLGLTIAALSADAARAADTPSRAQVAIPMKVHRYAQHLIDAHDANDDGHLSEQEWDEIGGVARLVDRDRDALITATELAEYIARYGKRRKILLMPAPASESAGFPSLLRPGEKTPKDKTDRLASGSEERVPSTASRAVNKTANSTEKLPTRRFTVPRTRMPTGLPSWFRSLDRNGDAQLTLAEFSPGSVTADIREFAQYDLNGDGMLTPDEYLRSSTRAAVSRSLGEVTLPPEENDELGVDELDQEDSVEMVDEGDVAELSEKESTAAVRKSMSAKEKAELKKQLKRTSRPTKNRSIKE